MLCCPGVFRGHILAPLFDCSFLLLLLASCLLVSTVLQSSSSLTSCCLSELTELDEFDDDDEEVDSLADCTDSRSLLSSSRIRVISSIDDRYLFIF